MEDYLEYVPLTHRTGCYLFIWFSRLSRPRGALETLDLSGKLSNAGEKNNYPAGRGISGLED